MSSQTSANPPTAAAPPAANAQMYSAGLRVMRGAFGVLGRVAPRVAGRLAYARFVTPPRFAAPARERTLVERAERFSVRFEGRDLAGYAWGDAGPIVLLVHGWAGRGAQLGSFVEPLLGRGFRVVTFDAPAHGASPGLSTNLPEFVRAVGAVGRAVGPIHAVIAHSFGAACTTAALGAGLRAARVVYLGAWVEPTLIVEKFADLFALPRPVTDDLARRLRERFGESIFEDYAGDRIAPALRMPALLVHDEADEDVPLDQSRRLQAAWPDARLITTRGLGHRRVLRDADVIERIVAFVDEGVQIQTMDGPIAAVSREGEGR